jgi:Pectate lyase superfamily protein
VSVGPDGKLVYKSMPRGDRILDFSHAGYMGGGVAIPRMMAAATVRPGDGDDTQRIQAAIDTVSRLALTQGVRGAVVVEAGTYEIGGTINIRASGVELRGSGSGTTIVELTGNPHLFVNMTGSGALQTTGSAANITDGYVPSGATSVTVDNAAAFKMGDTVLVRREITQKWIDLMQPEPLVRDGAQQTWMTPGQLVETERTTVAISGNTLRFDAPLTDAIDKDYVTPTGATVIKYTFAGRISNVGVSGFRVNGVPSTADIGADKYRLVDFGSVADAWARDLRGDDAVDAFMIRKQAKRITIEDVVLNRSVTTIGSAGPADFGITGSQVLIQRTQSNGNGQFSIVTHERVPGPNVLLQFSGAGTGKAQPHGRWATGLLYDQASFPQGYLELMHRGTSGDGHGWAIGWGVIWNGVAKQFLVQQPPGSANWCIGCVGEQLEKKYPGAAANAPVVPIGFIDSKNVPVTPASLYLAQLCERLGSQAVANIGY